MHAPRGVRAVLAWAIVTAVAATLALVSAPQADAATKTTTYTVASAVWVRASRSTSGKILGQLANGKHVLATGKATAGWIPVTYAGKTGYVSSSYLKKDAKAASVVVTGPAGTKTSTMKVPVRTKAKVTATAIKTYAKGTVMAVTGETSGIYTKVTVGTVKGWASTRRLTTATSVPLPRTVASYTTTDTLALRVDASVNSTNQVTIATGSTVAATGVHSGSYSQVVYKAKVGWVITGYLRAAAGTDAAYVLPMRVSTLTLAAATPVLAKADAAADVLATVPAGTTLRGTTSDGVPLVNGYTAVIWNGTVAWITAAPAAVSLGSSSLDKLEPNGKAAVLEVRSKFPQITTIYGWRSSSDYSSDHPNGRAVDFMIPDYKNNTALGDAVAQYFIDNLSRVHGTYVIWRQRIWTPYNGKWKAMEDRGSDTANHMNHVHVSFEPS
jgi:uncharacterized protein YgiM (DUF1202 family)